MYTSLGGDDADEEIMLWDDDPSSDNRITDNYYHRSKSKSKSKRYSTYDNHTPCDCCNKCVCCCCDEDDEELSEFDSYYSKKTGHNSAVGTCCTCCGGYTIDRYQALSLAWVCFVFGVALILSELILRHYQHGPGLMNRFAFFSSDADIIPADDNDKGEYVDGEQTFSFGTIIEDDEEEEEKEEEEARYVPEPPPQLQPDSIITRGAMTDDFRVSDSQLMYFVDG